MPETDEEWSKIASDYAMQWNFPNCCGSMDGKHIQIRPPPNSGSYYFNYKGTCSVILLALVDAHYRFIYADVGANGRVSDAAAWQNCGLKQRLETGQIRLPPPKPPALSESLLPYVYVADDAFPLTTNIMKPYSHRTVLRGTNIFLQIIQSKTYCRKCFRSTGKPIQGIPGSHQSISRKS